MTERRARGTSPAGRGDRRTSRSARSRPADADTAAAKRAARRRPEPDRRTTGDRKAQPRRIAARRSSTQRRSSDRAGRTERTFLGLSTGKAVILAAVVCALALTLAVPMRTYFGQRAEAAQLAQERTQLEADLAALRARRAQQEDPAYIRSEARDRLRLVMPGETPYIVQVPGIEAPAPPSAPTKAKHPDPWYTDLWQSVSQPQPSGAPNSAQPSAPQQDPEGPR